MITDIVMNFTLYELLKLLGELSNYDHNKYSRTQVFVTVNINWSQGPKYSNWYKIFQLGLDWTQTLISQENSAWISGLFSI